MSAFKVPKIQSLDTPFDVITLRLCCSFWIKFTGILKSFNIWSVRILISEPVSTSVSWRGTPSSLFCLLSLRMILTNGKLEVSFLIRLISTELAAFLSFFNAFVRLLSLSLRGQHAGIFFRKISDLNLISFFFLALLMFVLRARFKYPINKLGFLWYICSNVIYWRQWIIKNLFIRAS